MKAYRLQVKVMLLLGAVALLILPGVLASRALRTAHAGGPGARQDRPAEALDAARIAALSKLRAELKDGSPFSHEETDILKRFDSGGEVSAFEADVLISRVLYAYVKGNDLTQDMENLLKRYIEHIFPRTINIADVKEHIHSVELKEPPRPPTVAPSNDLCAGAEVIPAAGPFPYLTAITADITDATATGDPVAAPTCAFGGGPVSRSIWYKFTPSASGSYTFSSCADAPTGTTVDDTVVAIYTSAGGCAGPFTQVTGGCDDDTCVAEALQSVFTVPLVAGTEYFIVVWKFDLPAPTAGNTAVQLRVSQIAAPANDTCAGAIPLTLNIPVLGTMNSLTVNNYQLAAASPCYTGVGQVANILAGRDLVYTFTAPAAGTYSFRVWRWSGSTNPGIYIASACPAGAPPQTVTCTAASNRNTNTSLAAEEIACQALSSGEQVFFFVDEVTVASTATVTFFAEVLSCVPETEANGTPATANAYQCGIQGGTTPASDVDFYSLGTPATDARVFAMLDSGPANNNDHDLRVTTTTDTLEYDDVGNVNTFGNNAPNIAGARTTGVQTFLRVNHFSNTNSEPYRIFSVVQPPGAGAFGSSAVNEVEPNNNGTQANGAPGNYFYGTVTAGTDTDFYVFPATAGDTIFVSLDGDPSRVTGTAGSSSPLDAILSLFDPSGAQLVGVDDTGNTSSITSGAGSLTATTPFAPSEALVFHAQTTGNYFVGVAAFTGTGDYLLSISKNCAPGGGSSCTGITCPANITLPNDPNQCGAVVTYPTPTPNGICGTITCAPASGSFFPVGTTTVTCTSSAGPSCSFTVTINDTQPPTITCPANITVSNDPGQCGAVVNYPPPTVSDNCPGVGAPTCAPASGSFFQKGTTTVTCNVLDAVGNTAACSFTITVNDTQPPTITCPANITQSNDPNQCGAVVNYPPPTVSDNCPGVGAPVCVPASGTFFPVGTTTVTCTVADAVGNTAACSFTITVVDTQPPTITCPANQTAVTGQDACPSASCLVVNFPPPVATDNCPGVVVVCNPPAGSCFPVGVTTVTCTATDTSGNTATCSFTVTLFDVVLQDDSDPTIVLLWNSFSGQYRFCCKGVTYTGIGKATTQGCVFTLQHNPVERRVLGRVDKAVHSGTASIQSPPGTIRCTITDRNTLNDTPVCQ